MKTAKRCMVCGKALRDFNKSGVCSNCNKSVSKKDINKHVKRKLNDIKKIIDGLLGELE